MGPPARGPTTGFGVKAIQQKYIVASSAKLRTARGSSNYQAMIDQSAEHECKYVESSLRNDIMITLLGTHAPNSNGDLRRWDFVNLFVNAATNDRTPKNHQQRTTTQDKAFEKSELRSSFKSNVSPTWHCLLKASAIRPDAPNVSITCFQRSPRLRCASKSKKQIQG